MAKKAPITPDPGTPATPDDIEIPAPINVVAPPEPPPAPAPAPKPKAEPLPQVDFSPVIQSIEAGFEKIGKALTPKAPKSEPPPAPEPIPKPKSLTFFEELGGLFDDLAK